MSKRKEQKKDQDPRQLCEECNRPVEHKSGQRSLCRRCERALKRQRRDKGRQRRKRRPDSDRERFEDW